MKFNVGNVERDCEWLNLRPGAAFAVCVEGNDAYRACPETCNACDGNTPSPTHTPSPTIGPTETENPTSKLCDDTDGLFEVSFLGTKEPCIWLQARPQFVEGLCIEGSEAYTVCPETCGACVDDCEDSDAEFLLNGVNRSCEWLRIRPGAQAALCIEGSEAYLTCPETCNACDQL